MTSAPCDWRRRFPDLTYPEISAKLQPLGRSLSGQRPLFLVLRPDWGIACLLSRETRFWRCTRRHFAE